MNHLDMVLAARSFCCGRAQRTASLRHRRLVSRPLAVVLFQLGAEPFSAAALGWGEEADRRWMAVAGEPRSRHLAFAALLRFANWFNPRFEAHASDRETISRGHTRFERARTAPQVLVANAATAQLLARLGRRLAYLPANGSTHADPALVRLGRHLLFLGDHWAFPGQQLMVSLTDLLEAHWTTAQSPLERQSLAALDAYLEPRNGIHGFEAAAAAEGVAVGPLPGPDDDARLEPQVNLFNRRRGGATDAAIVQPLLAPIVEHYRPLLLRAWDLLWRCRNREAAFPEAPSVGRRWDHDREAYTRHIDWVLGGGRRRTRQTARQAARTLGDFEEAKRLLEAEEACDDPVRMIPYLLAQKAVRGRVIAVDLRHREPGARAMVWRPLVTLEQPDPCSIPPGRELWWSENPSGCAWEVAEVRDTPSGGSLIVLKRMTGWEKAGIPVLGAEVCFSIHSTARGYVRQWPPSDPWTHLQSQAPEPVVSLEEEEGGAP